MGVPERCALTVPHARGLWDGEKALFTASFDLFCASLAEPFRSLEVAEGLGIHPDATQYCRGSRKPVPAALRE